MYSSGLLKFASVLIIAILPEKILCKNYGTVMRPKNACSYADVAMGIIDEKAKFEGSLKPLLWRRYIEMTFSTFGLKVGQNCLNSLTTLILCTPPSNSNWPIRIVLFACFGSYITLKDGLIITDICYKPNDSHL